MAVYTALQTNRVTLAQHYAWVPLVDSPQRVTGFIQQGLGQYTQGLGYHAGLWVDGVLCGVVGYPQAIDTENRSARLGYWITPSASGKGLITQAFAQMIPHAIEAYGLNRLTFRALAHHPQSQTVPQKLGFTLEGVLHGAYALNGHRHDLNLYAITAPQWQSRLSEAPHV